MRQKSGFDFRWSATICFAAAILSSAAHGQVLRKGAPARPAAPAAPGVAAPVAPAPGETAGQTRREGRQEAREARSEAKSAGETRPQARETARETRQETRQNIQATRAADLGLWFNGRANEGLVISDIANNSVFSSAGFREGDRIVSVNGRPITTESQFMQYLTGPNLGTQPIQVVVFRNGQQQTLSLQPTALTQGIVAYDPLYQYGILVDDRSPNQLAIQRVYPRTPAYYAGLRQGDVITTFGGQPITSLDAFTQGLSQASGPLALQVTRAGQTRDIQLEPFVSSQDSVRTALRPNLDGNAALDGRAGAAGTAPGVAPSSTPQTPGAAPSAAPRASEAAPGASAPRRLSPPSGTTPATPRQPGVSPATPATPATPTQPKSREGAAPGTGAAPPAPAAPSQPRTGGEAAPAAGTTPAAPGSSSGTGTSTPR
jgi:type II secretory pathway component PulC